MKALIDIQLAAGLDWRFQKSFTPTSGAFAKRAEGWAQLGRSPPRSPGSFQVVTPAEWSDCLSAVSELQEGVFQDTGSGSCWSLEIRIHKLRESCLPFCVGQRSGRICPDPRGGNVDLAPKGGVPKGPCPPAAQVGFPFVYFSITIHFSAEGASLFRDLCGSIF